MHDDVFNRFASLGSKTRALAVFASAHDTLPRLGWLPEALTKYQGRFNASQQAVLGRTFPHLMNVLVWNGVRIESAEWKSSTEAVETWDKSTCTAFFRAHVGFQTDNVDADNKRSAKALAEMRTEIVARRAQGEVQEKPRYVPAIQAFFWLCSLAAWQFT